MLPNSLTPDRLHLETAPDGTLRAQIEGDRCGINVQVLRAMPLSAPDELVVLRDGGGKELGLLEKLKDFDASTRQLLQDALENRYFLPKILKINSIYERFGSAQWEVETDRGPASISTKAMHEAIMEIGPNRYLLRDNEENRFEIPNINELDEASRMRFAGKF
jgi:hypothetical protein